MSFTIIMRRAKNDAMPLSAIFLVFTKRVVLFGMGAAQTAMMKRLIIIIFTAHSGAGVGTANKLS
jgi:hypothetical protein